MSPVIYTLHPDSVPIDGGRAPAFGVFRTGDRGASWRVATIYWSGTDGLCWLLMRPLPHDDMRTLLELVERRLADPEVRSSLVPTAVASLL